MAKLTLIYNNKEIEDFTISSMSLGHFVVTILILQDSLPLYACK